MSSSTKQGIYATKTAKTTSNLNTPSSKVSRCFITYSVLTVKKQYTVQDFLKKTTLFLAKRLRYLTYLKVKPRVV